MSKAWWKNDKLGVITTPSTYLRGSLTASSCLNATLTWRVDSQLGQGCQPRQSSCIETQFFVQPIHKFDLGNLLWSRVVKLKREDVVAHCRRLKILKCNFC
ncbi:hypothetical protein CYMTET_6052 [Cymbomonas tetramitiformis]|uniref:Uncharacterized protein n=1 Tax=Cymbomonas tetramitiformis TaxID=36881 RepID=A0AAE0GYG2_9CHLO|nr:hypothetical protein CYMTET_6052 [Cymbomonas tetramitiformis]